VTPWPGADRPRWRGSHGRALAAGILRADPARASALRLADALPAVAEEAAGDLRAGLGGAAEGPTAASVAEAAGADLVCLAVKPGDVESALSQ